jgi:hypothetical protein
MNFRKTMLLSFFISCGIQYAQQPFFVPMNGNFPVAATAINSMDIESADVDNDGDLDLVIAAEYSRNLLFFNDGNGVFSEDPSRLFPEKNTGDPFTGEDSEDIAFADFNNDNKIDILFVSEDTDFHELLVNDGNGGFSFISYEFPASAGNAIAVLDLNGDDYPDIIIGNTGQNNVFINNQDLSFTQENNRWPVNTEGTQDLKMVDLDNDGDLDIIEGIDLGSNNVLINANGFFSEENNRLPDTGLTLETRKISLGDANGDGFPDIFVSTVNFIGTANLQNRLYLNDGNGFFTDATSSNLPAYEQFTLDALFYDYDLDGDQDLITTDFQNPAGNYHALENDGSGHFSEVTETVFASFAFTRGVGLHMADLNGDGYEDLYFSNFQETDDLLFFSEAALTVEDVPLGSSFVIYPNPTSDFIKLRSNYSEIEKVEIRATDGSAFEPLELIKDTIDLSRFATGTYLLLITTRDRMIVKKIVIQ